MTLLRCLRSLLMWLPAAVALGFALAAPSSALACAARPVPLDSLSGKLDLPKASWLTQAWSCHDAQGEELVIAAHAPAQKNGSGLGEELIFQKYRQTASGWKKDWQARDFLGPGLTSRANTSSELILIGDFDGDGLADIFIAYTLPGQPVPPDEGKLLVFHKDQKYALRGAIARSRNDFGSRKITARFLTLPQPLQDQALKLWDKLNMPRR